MSTFQDKLRHNAKIIAEMQAMQEINAVEAEVARAPTNKACGDAIVKRMALLHRYVPGLGYLRLAAGRFGWNPEWVDEFKTLEPNLHTWEPPSAQAEQSRKGVPSMFQKTPFRLFALCTKCKMRWYEDQEGNRFFIDDGDTLYGRSISPCQTQTEHSPP